MDLTSETSVLWLFLTTSKKLGEIYRYEVHTFVDSKHGKTLIDQVKTIDKND